MTINHVIKVSFIKVLTSVHIFIERKFWTNWNLSLNPELASCLGSIKRIVFSKAERKEEIQLYEKNIDEKTSYFKKWDSIK